MCQIYRHEHFLPHQSQDAAHPHRSGNRVKATHRRPYQGHTHYLLITGRMPLDTRVIQAMSYPIPWYIQTRLDLPPSVIKDVAGGLPRHGKSLASNALFCHQVHTQSLESLSIKIILSEETSPTTGDETINERLHHSIYPYPLRDAPLKGPSYHRIWSQPPGEPPGDRQSYYKAHPKSLGKSNQ